MDNSVFTTPLQSLQCLSDRILLLLHRLIYEAVVKRLFDVSLFGFGMVDEFECIGLRFVNNSSAPWSHGASGIHVRRVAAFKLHGSSGWC